MITRTKETRKKAVAGQDVPSNDWVAGDIIEMDGTSFTTGQTKTFTFDAEEWSKRGAHYPVWCFDHSTKRIIKAS